jgi:PhnB protein
MKHINSYLTFNGNCREAMNFYRDCLGGELTFQTVGESPLCEQMPAIMKESILHSCLTNNNVILMGTDMVGEQGLHKGNAVALVLHCSNEEEIRQVYDKLAEGGEKTHPLGETFWGALFGDLKDKYGHIWMLNLDKAPINN